MAELSGRFNMKLFKDQVTFMILEGSMIIVVCSTLLLFHPGVSIQGLWHEMRFVFWEEFTFNRYCRSDVMEELADGGEGEWKYKI